MHFRRDTSKLNREEYCYEYIFALMKRICSSLDVNECNDTTVTVCQQTCENTEGSYVCHCFHGYRETGGVCQGKEKIVLWYEIFKCVLIGFDRKCWILLMISNLQILTNVPRERQGANRTVTTRMVHSFVPVFPAFSYRLTTALAFRQVFWDWIKMTVIIIFRLSFLEYILLYIIIYVEWCKIWGNLFQNRTSVSELDLSVNMPATILPVSTSAYVRLDLNSQPTMKIAKVGISKSGVINKSSHTLF